MGNLTFPLHTFPNDNNGNEVEAATSVRISFSNSEEILSVMDIPYMSSNSYSKCHDIICDGWEATPKILMKEPVKKKWREN